MKQEILDEMSIEELEKVHNFLLMSSSLSDDIFPKDEEKLKEHIAIIEKAIQNKSNVEDNN